MTEPLYAAVSPVFSVDGQREGDLARDCVRLEICEATDGLKTAELHLLAVGGGAPGPPGPMLHLGAGVVDFGKTLSIAVGATGQERTVFEGVISAIEAVFVDGEPPLIVVLAEDALMRLRMTRRMRTYRNVTDGDIASELASEHGLQADVGVDGPRYDVVQQLNQSDLAFLRERARLVQAELWCSQRTLHFCTRSNREGTTITLVQGNHLLRTRLAADLAHQRSSISVSGYDAEQKDVIDETAGADTIDSEIAGGITGARLVSRALGTAASHRVREAALTSTEANAWAKAEMLRRCRRFVTVDAVARGVPEMIVGSRARLEQVGAPFEGDGYYVTSVRHTYDLSNGLQTQFCAERATLNEVR